MDGANAHKLSVKKQMQFCSDNNGSLNWYYLIWFIQYISNGGTINETWVYILSLYYAYESTISQSQQVVIYRSYDALADADQMRRTWGWLCLFGFICFCAVLIVAYGTAGLG